MTTVETHTDDAQEAAQCWLGVDALVAHPDNPRRTVGDLAELVRSVKGHGVLMPLLVLPADEDGRHRIVAGHRRHAAATTAGLERVPVIVRSMTDVEVVEAMLVENEHRGDLTVSEQVHAIERLMSLEDGLTPAKLCRRIGKSKAWVRTRMTLAVLPQAWRARIDAGDLTVAAAEAATTIADLGPEHLDAVLDRLLAGATWQDPTRVVDGYRQELERSANYDRAVEQAQRGRSTVFMIDDPPPTTATPVGDLFSDDAAIRAHRKLDCHAKNIRRVSWGDGVDVTELCTQPRSHRPTADAGSDGDSDGGKLVSDRTPAIRGADDSAAKRKGRVARIEHLAEVFGRARGGPAKTDLTQLALRALIHDAGQEPLKHAAAVLAIEPTERLRDTLIALADDSPTNLARVAAAIACGIAEGHMYWSPTSAPCTEYLALLCDQGWSPDEWTAQKLAETLD